jgi:hypothetical protein
LIVRVRARTGRSVAEVFPFGARTVRRGVPIIPAMRRSYRTVGLIDWPEAGSSRFLFAVFRPVGRRC